MTGTDDSMGKRERMRCGVGGSGVERGEGVYKDGGRWSGAAVLCPG